MAEAAQIGVTGLAVMGRNLARNFARHGHRVAIHNRSYAKTESLIAEAGSEGTFIPSKTLADFVASLEKPRRVLIMVKAGPGTDAVIDELVPLLDEGDIVIDAGNAHFPDTIRREAQLAELGLHFVGTGVSGGEEGALNGPSIMPGGSRESYEWLGPLLESISAKVDGEPCCTYVGPDGAGHFVKMVHNGIEYADMQLIAEAYDLIKQATGAERRGAREDLLNLERGRPRVVPDRDHRRCARPCRCRDRKAVRRPRARSGGAEGHRPLDGAERPRSRRADHRHRRGDLRPRPVRLRAAAQGRPGPAGRRTPAIGRSPTRTPSSRTSVRRCTRRRWSPTPRASTRSRPPAPSTRLEHRPRGDGPDLARRLHHPGALPEPDHRGVRARSRAAVAARRRLFR